MRQLFIMTAADLRQRFRDRSVLIFGLIVPIALMSVMNLVFETEEVSFDPVTVAASADPQDELASAVLEALTEVPGLEVTVEQASADEVRPRVEAGAEMGLTIPEGFGDSVSQGQGAAIGIIRGDGAGMETEILIAVIEGVTDRFSTAATAAGAGAELGLDPEQLGAIGQSVAEAEPLITSEAGETASEQLDASGTVVAGQAGLFLLFTVGFGVIALINEREQGTLTRLQTMPMRPGLIVAAKALSAYTLGVLATTVLLTAGSLLFGVSFGSAGLVAVLVLSVVAAATSLTFIVARLARTAEQANVAQAILAVGLGMFGGAFFPISSTGLAGTLLDLNPVAAFTRGLGITTGGGGLADLAVPIGTMLGFALVGLVVSRLIPDRGAGA